MSQTATYEKTYEATSAAYVDLDFLYDGSGDEFVYIHPDGYLWELRSRADNHWKAPVDSFGPALIMTFKHRVEKEGLHGNDVMSVLNRGRSKLSTVEYVKSIVKQYGDNVVAWEPLAMPGSSLPENLPIEEVRDVLKKGYGSGATIMAHSARHGSGKITLPRDKEDSALKVTGEPENLPKPRHRIVRRKWARPRPKWKIDREMVRAAVKKARRLEALDRARPVTYAAYTDGNGNKVREPSDYKPRPTTEMPRHPDYWEAYWTQWERRMEQLRRGKDDPKGWAVKLRNYIESRIDDAHYRKMARDGIFWRGVYERLQQQYDYACLERADEFGPEEFKKHYIKQTLPSEDGWRKIVTSTMPYVEVYPVVHVLSAFYGGSTESNLSAMECAGRRLMMYADLKKAARALMVTKPEIVAERLPAATQWAVDNFDGNILNFMGKVVGKLDAPTRKAGRRVAKDPASSESDNRALSLDRMKDDYDFEPEIEEGVYEGDPTEEYSVVGDVAEILAGRERYAELRGLVREHLKGDQRDWALLKLSGVDSTEELCKKLDTDPAKLKRTAYAARAKLKKENRARKLYEGDPEFSDVARLIGGGVRVPHKAGRGKAPRDLRPGAKRTRGWPVVGKASEERLAKMGEMVRPHRVRRRYRPAPEVKGIRDQRLIEYLTLWGSPTEDFETLGSYPSRWPLLRGRDSSAAYDPKKGRQSAGKFLMLMDRAKGMRHGRIGPLVGMNHRLKNDVGFKDYSVAEKEIVEDGNYA